MTAQATTDRRAARHEATKQRILAAAWDLAREQGLAGISLRDLAARVDLRQPSLYSYFDSKDALYDAMFAQGYEQLLADVEPLVLTGDAHQQIRELVRVFVGLATSDVARAQLLFQRTLPGFEPSAPSYALAARFLDDTRRFLVAAGFNRQEDVDLYTALVGGLVNQQIANDPGGTRWLDLVDEAVDMYLAACEPAGRGHHMMSTAMNAKAIAPIDHREAMRVTEVEFGRMLSAARELAPDDWTQPTVNTGWDVRAVMLHLLGAAEANVSFRENAHQMRTGKRLFKEIGGHHWVDGVNEIQIRERAALTNEEVIDRFAAVIPGAVRARSRVPRPVRALPLVDFGAPLGRKSLGYLLDMVYTRDVWMHRVDIARATGRSLELTPGHDGRIVADIVAEWARLYDHEFELELEGPAGGTYTSGAGGERLRIDAVEFVCILSGRGSGTGLLALELPL